MHIEKTLTHKNLWTKWLIHNDKAILGLVKVYQSYHFYVRGIGTLKLSFNPKFPLISFMR